MKTSIFVFMAGDNNLDASGTQDVQEMLNANFGDDINLIVQFDRRRAMPWEDPAERSTKRFSIRKGEITQIEDIGETNTGDPAVLKDFLSWCTKNYASERNIVIVWNHGGGIKDAGIYKSFSSKVKSSLFVPKRERSLRPMIGAKAADMKGLEKIDSILNAAERMICTDDTSRDFLDNIELKSAMDIGFRFDIVAFDACLMNMLEVIYQLRNQTDYVIGSQEIVPPEGWPYRIVLEELASNTSMSNPEFLKMVASKFVTSYTDPTEHVTQSALSTTSIEETAAAVDRFAASLLEAWPSVKGDVFELLFEAQRFRESDYIDLDDFCTLCREGLDEQSIKESADAVRNSLAGNIVTNQTKGEEVANAHGLSIYMPLKKPDAEIIEMYKQMDFNRNHKNWYNLISTVHTKKREFRHSPKD